MVLEMYFHVQFSYGSVWLCFLFTQKCKYVNVLRLEMWSGINYNILQTHFLLIVRVDIHTYMYIQQNKDHVVSQDWDYAHRSWSLHLQYVEVLALYQVTSLIQFKVERHMSAVSWCCNRVRPGFEGKSGHIKQNTSSYTILNKLN